MSELSAPARRQSRRWLLPALVIAAVLGAAAGAYLDWYMWHPMSAIVTTIGLIMLLIAGGLAVLVRSRVRPIGMILLALAVGGFAGQVGGPSRPVTHRTETGSIRLVLTAPSAFDASGDATCGLVEEGGQILVDPGEFGTARTSADADFHYVSVAVGDMWDFGHPMARRDHVSVTIRVIPELVPADGKPAEQVYATDPDSTVTLGPTTQTGGSITFANLAIGDPTARSASSGRSDLAGTVSWTCGPIVPGTNY